MMSTWVAGVVLLLTVVQAAPPQRATVSPQTFVGTWVGTQSWAIDSPPPGARQDQPVSLTIDLVDGKITGTMTPFMGGQDGATFVSAQIVGDELHADAVVGRPRPAPVARGEAPGAADAPGGRGRGRRGGPPPTWKDPVRIQFTFKNDGTALTGAADITMNDVKWLKFKYDLSRKRSRY
jgi:hypothetical protein